MTTAVDLGIEKPKNQNKRQSIKEAAQESKFLGHTAANVAPHNTVKHIQDVQSSRLCHQLKRALTTWMENSLKYTGLIVVVARDEKITALLSQWQSSVKQRHTSFLGPINEELDMLLAAQPEKAKRLAGLELRTPEQFQFCFSNNYFWDYIDLLEEVDKTLVRLESYELTGIISSEYRIATESSIISYTSSVFRSLDSLSNVRRRRTPVNTKVTFDDLQNVINSLDAILAKY